MASQINRTDVLTSFITVSQTHDDQKKQTKKKRLHRKVGLSLDLTDNQPYNNYSQFIIARIRQSLNLDKAPFNFEKT